MTKLQVVRKWVGLGLVQSFLLILGRVGLGRVKKIGPTFNSDHNKRHNEDTQMTQTNTSPAVAG